MSKEFKPNAYRPAADCIYNPLKKFPRNLPCPCLSGKKFKNCHLNLIAPVIKADKLKPEWAAYLEKIRKDYKERSRG